MNIDIENCLIGPFSVLFYCKDYPFKDSKRKSQNCKKQQIAYIILEGPKYKKPQNLDFKHARKDMISDINESIVK